MAVVFSLSLSQVSSPQRLNRDFGAESPAEDMEVDDPTAVAGRSGRSARGL
jgi:hypothetical protein